MFPSLSQTTRSLVAPLAASALALAAGPAFAAAGQWDSAVAGFSGSGANAANPWINAPAAGSSYAEWNAIFGYPVDDTPDIGGSGKLTETTGAAFPTSGGNVYSISGASAFRLDLAGATSGLHDVYLRVSTVGSSVADVASLNGLNATRVVTFNQAITGGFGGNEEESLWRWTVNASGPWVVNFNASGAHMSLDQVGFYAVAVTPAVPEPETWALMLAGLAAVGAARAARNRRA